VLTLCGDGAALRVKGGLLEVFDQGVKCRFEPSSKTPKAVVFAGWGGFLTMQAVRFCAEHKIAIIFADWTGSLPSFVAPAPNPSASLIRAQVLSSSIEAERIKIACEVIRQKLLHSKVSGKLTAAETRKLCAALQQARSVADVLRIEARAAIFYWDRRQCELRTRPHHTLPQIWKRFSQRLSPLSQRGPQRAVHPVNAMLNYCYSVAAGRLAAHLTAGGAHVAIGFLHGDKPGRFSLVYDALEPRRPSIDNYVFKFIEEHRFDRGDFLRLSTGEVRIVPNLIKVLIQETALPESDIDQASEFMVDRPSRTMISDARFCLLAPGL
jgi:CRISPR-associated protein Cas1